MNAFSVRTLIVHGAAEQITPIDLTARKTAQAVVVVGHAGAIIPRRSTAFV
jgi:hypothetical protein